VIFDFLTGKDVDFSLRRLCGGKKAGGKRAGNLDFTLSL